MSANVVTFPRPYRGPARPTVATTPFSERLPMRIDKEITVNRLVQGLQSVGLDARFDVGTGEIVIEEQGGWQP